MKTILAMMLAATGISLDQPSFFLDEGAEHKWIELENKADSAILFDETYRDTVEIEGFERPVILIRFLDKMNTTDAQLRDMQIAVACDTESLALVSMVKLTKKDSFTIAMLVKEPKFQDASILLRYGRDDVFKSVCGSDWKSIRSDEGEA